MLVYFKVTYFMIKWNDFKTDMESLVLTVPSENENEVTVNIFPNESKIESFHELCISMELLEALRNKKFDYRAINSEGILDDFEDTNLIPIPNEIRHELVSIISNITNCTKKVISLFKYCLRIYQINTKIQNIYISWSFDKSNWQRIMFSQSIPICPIFLYNLNENMVQYIQDCLTNGFEPFLALKYLHKALEEHDTNIKVINAATAAELAIKEFFIRIQPNIEIFLLEVPSPPLNILYGKILKEYTKEKYSRASKIKKLVEARNDIIHKPENLNLTELEAYNHIIEVEFAIYY